MLPKPSSVRQHAVTYEATFETNLFLTTASLKTAAATAVAASATATATAAAEAAAAAAAAAAARTRNSLKWALNLYDQIPLFHLFVACAFHMVKINIIYLQRFFS